MATKLEMYQALLNRGDYDKIPEGKRNLVDALVSRGDLTMGGGKVVSPEIPQQEPLTSPYGFPPGAVSSTERLRDPAAGQMLEESAAKIRETGEGLLGSLIGMGKAAVGDVGELATAYGQMIQHPIQTAESLGRIPLGLIQKAIPGEQEAEKTFDAVLQHYKELFSRKGWQKAAAEDPLKTMLELSPLLGGKGLKAASYIDPLAATAKVTKAGGKEILERLGGKFAEERLMASALKTGGPFKKHKKDVQLALEKRIGTTEKFTLEPMQKRLGEITKEVDSNIAAVAGKDARVDLSKFIAEGYDQEIAKRRYDLTATKDVELLLAERDAVLKKYGKEVSLEDALKFKRTTDKSLTNLWSKAEKSRAPVFETVASHDASKNVANLLRNHLNKFSTNAALNKEASELLTLIPHIEKRIVQGRSKNVIPFGSGEAIAAVKAMGGDVTSAGLMLSAAKMAESSPLKAAGARRIRAGRTAAPARVGKYQALTQAALRNQQMQEQATRERKTFR